MTIVIKPDRQLVNLFASGQLHAEQCQPVDSKEKEHLRLLILESLKDEKH